MNRKYDTEFKRESVRLVLEEGLRVREVERNLGITHGVLKDWVQKHRDHQDAAYADRPALSPEEELKQLRKENERLRRERDILKKAVAIFSTDQQNGSAKIRLCCQGYKPSLKTVRRLTAPYVSSTNCESKVVE
jgi:transposase